MGMSINKLDVGGVYPTIYAKEAVEVFSEYLNTNVGRYWVYIVQVKYLPQVG